MTPHTMCFLLFYLYVISPTNAMSKVTKESSLEKNQTNKEDLDEIHSTENHLVLLLPGDGERSSPPCCRAPDVLSCLPASINASLLAAGTGIHLPGTKNLLAFANMVPPAGYHYLGMQGEEAILSISSTTGFLFGTLKTEGRAFTLEHCTTGYHWIEYKVEDFAEEEEEYEDDTKDDEHSSGDVAADDGGMVEFSVMIYYTPEFAAITSDIPGFVDQVLAETNQGYVNSNIPMTIKLHCIEPASISDTSSSSALMLSFMAMKKMSAAALRHSADAAVLLVASMGNYCGRAHSINSIGSGHTISVCAKSCALGYFTFGHEIAHNIGAYHNRETGHINPYYPHGQGHLIDKGAAASGARSILAYYAVGHYTRVNYYSNPNVILNITGTATGTTDSNNAAVLFDNRHALSRVGDESVCCNCNYDVPLGSRVVEFVVSKINKIKSIVFSFFPFG